MNAIQVASLFAAIDLKDNATGGLGKLDNALKNTAKNLTDMGATLTKGLTLPIVGFLGASLKAASDSQTVIAQLNAVLKSTKGVAGVTAKAATDLAKSLQKVTRYSDEDVLSAENLLLTFTKIKKDTFPQVTKLALDMSTALGQDLKSSSIQLGKALQDPITGVTALRRVGVNFTQSQMDMIKSMMAVGNLAGAQKIILKELSTEFGGSAEAAGNSFAGKLDILKNKFKDLMETIGTMLMPVLMDGMTLIGGFVDKLAALNPNILKIGVVALAGAAGLGPLLSILGNIGKVIGAILSPLGLLIAGITFITFAMGTNWMGVVTTANRILFLFWFVLNQAAQAASNLAKVIGFVLLDTLNKAATAAGQLVTIAGFLLFGALNAAAMAARQLGQAILLFVFDALNKAAGAATWLIGQLRQLLGLSGTETAEKGTGGSPLMTNGKPTHALSKQIANATSVGARGVAFRDSGGPVRAGQSVMVGRGAQPELFVPSSSGRMFPAGSYGGPQTVTVVLRADNFEDHIVVNLASAMRKGTS